MTVFCAPQSCQTWANKTLKEAVMKKTLLAFAALAAFAATTPALAALAVGAKAPDFSAPAAMGGKAFNFNLDSALKKGP